MKNSPIYFLAGMISLAAVPLRADDSAAPAGVPPANALTVAVEAFPDSVKPGENLFYTIIVGNQSGVSLPGVTLQALIPQNIVSFTAATFLSDAGTCPGGICDSTENATWNLGTLAPGQSRAITMSTFIKVSPLPADGTPVVTQATGNFTGSSGPTIASRTVTIDNSPVMRLAMDESQDPILPTRSLTYTLIYANRSALFANNATLTAPVPTGTTFVSATGGGTEAGGTITWNLGTLNGGENGHRTFTVTVNSGLSSGDVLNAQGQLTETGDATDIANSYVATSIQSVDSPLALTIETGPDPVRPGENLHYTITLTNQGAIVLNGISLRASIPEFISSFTAATYLSDAGNCPGNICDTGDMAIWNIGSLNAGQSRTITMSTFVEAAPVPADGSMLRTMAIATYTGASAPSIATRTALVNNALALRLSMEESLDPVIRGNVLTYTLNYSNPSAGFAPNAVLSASIPSGTTFLSATDSGAASGGRVSWPLGTLSGGENGRRFFSVTVDAGLFAGTVLQSEAEIVDTADPANSAYANAATTVRAAESTLLIAVEASSDPVKPGENLLYTLTVSNQGTDPVSGVTLRASIPQSIASFAAGTYLSDGGTCPGNICDTGDFATWSLGALNPGQSRSVTMSTFVDTAPLPSDGSLLHLTAVATASDGSEPIASKTVLVNNTPVIRLTMEDSLDPAIPGSTQTYTLIYANRGAVFAPGVTLNSPIPEGASFLSSTGGGSVIGGRVTWDVGMLSPGETGRRSYSVTLNGGLHAGALVQAQGELRDTADPADSSHAYAMTTLEASDSPLTLALEPSADPVRPGAPLLYTITITNKGAFSLGGVTLSALIPEHITSFAAATYLSDSGTCPGNICDTGDLASWAVGTLEPAESRTFTVSTFIPISVVLAPDGTQIHLQALATYTSSAAGTGPALSPTIAQRTVLVQSAPVINLSMEESQDPVAPGSDLTYTLLYGNRSGAIVPNTVLTAQVPSGTTFVSASDGGTASVGVVTWTVGSISPGVFGMRQFTVNVDGATAGGTQFQTQSELRDSATPANFARGYSATAVKAVSPLTLTMSDLPDLVLPGGSLLYSLTVSNQGGVGITGVTLRATIPENIVSFGNAQLSDAGVCPGNICDTGDNATWSFGTLNPGQTRNVTMTTTVSGSASNGALIESRAVVLAPSSGLQVSTWEVTRLGAPTPTPTPIPTATATPTPTCEPPDVILTIPSGQTATVDYAASGGNAQGWIGGNLQGFGGTTSVGASGLCMTVPGPGDNAVLWVSQERFVELMSGTIYKVHLALSTDQTAPDAIPLFFLAYDNFNSCGNGNNYGGFYWVLDVDGGAEGIGRAQGKSAFDFYIVPNAINTTQWISQAFTPAADGENDLRLQYRIIDANSTVLTENDSGSICISTVQITAIARDPLQWDQVYNPPIASATHFPMANGDPGAGTATIDDVNHWARYQISTSGDNRRTLGPYDPTAGSDFNTQLFPVIWEANKLYRVRASIRAESAVNDPVDAIFLSIDTTTNELGMALFTTRGAPGGPMDRAASPKLTAAQYEGYFFSHNATASVTPNAGRLRPLAFFFNAASQGGDGTGGDAFIVDGLAVDRLVPTP